MKNLIVFGNKKIRRIWHENEWYFSVVDIVGILSESKSPTSYWRKLKERLKKEGNETVTYCHTLKMKALDNKMRSTDVANVEGLFRIIQSVPSPNAEPFKRWLAKVGYERIEEIENPEIATTRMRDMYRQKGYSEGWIEKRMRGIEVRDELTKEWRKRGVKEHLEFAILTSEISKATFGMTPAEYKKFKNLSKPKENLRDHMTDLELIFTMLGEASTTEIAKTKNAKGFKKNKEAATEGGKVAGDARKALEKKTGTKVSTKDNFKKVSEKKKKGLN